MLENKMPKDHITREQFLLEFFGPLGRELGNPDQRYTDNPAIVIPFIDECTNTKKPAFISVQPRTAHHKVYGIEKIFYDFDFGKKNQKLTEKQIDKHKKRMTQEFRIFLNQLLKSGITPLIIKTRKGFHAHIFFDRIYQIDDDIEFWRKVYRALHHRFVKNGRHKYKYVDTTSKADIFRLCRIPTSIHEKNGKECIVLDINLKPTKLRSLEYFKMYGLRRDDLVRTVEIVRINEEKRKERIEKLQSERKENWVVEHGFVGEIRPCFKVRMDKKEMSHQQRLALLIEGFYTGHRTRDEMVELFKCFNDFDETKTRAQVDWFFDNKVDEDRHGEPKCKIKPYKCSTIREHGWCLKRDCQTYQKQIRSEKNAKS